MKDGRTRLQGAVEAVAEVGNPTIVATLTVVAALLPMLFVSGLMGPYMAPIPANASAAMLFSFFVAMVIAPWLMLRLHPEGQSLHEHGAAHGEGPLGRLYRRSPLQWCAPQECMAIPDRGRGGDDGGLPLFATKSVTVKLLPFDNKSEMAVVVDLPEGATTRRHRADPVLNRRRPRPARNPLHRDLRRHRAPFNFNGLVRHSYLARLPELGELQVNLAPRAERAAPATPSRSICVKS